MHRLRRATAFLVLLLLVQLTLVGSGFTCPSDGGTTSNSAMAGMPGMAGTTTSAAMSDMGSGQSHGGGADEPAPGSDSCNLPWAPGGCALMIPCAPHALATSIAVSAAPGSPSRTELAWELGTPPSAIITPDPPPPKA